MTHEHSATTSASEFIDYENDLLDEGDTIAFFQDLIDSGRAWQMQGSYGRSAMQMIKNGQCMLGPIGYRDFYGNYIPSRDEVVSGSPGSAEYVLESLAA